jgi:hypothetical protein
VTLTNKQISALDERANEFQAGDHQTQEEIVEEFFDSFKATHPQGRGANEFDKVTVKTVCALFAMLGCSQPFLAYSPAPLWEKDTSNESIHFKYPNLGG